MSEDASLIQVEVSELVMSEPYRPQAEFYKMNLFREISQEAERSMWFHMGH
jgi:hypothetical protein